MTDIKPIKKQKPKLKPKLQIPVTDEELAIEAANFKPIDVLIYRGKTFTPTR